VDVKQTRRWVSAWPATQFCTTVWKSIRITPAYIFAVLKWLLTARLSAASVDRRLAVAARAGCDATTFLLLVVLVAHLVRATIFVVFALGGACTPFRAVLISIGSLALPYATARLTPADRALVSTRNAGLAF